MTRTRKTFILVLLLLAVWGFLSFRIGAAWFGHQDANGAWISSAILNYERYGFGSLGGMIILNNSPLQPDQRDQYVYYPNHPPLPVWMPALPVLVLGYDEAIVRFVFAACTLLSIAALYGLVRRLFGGMRALWSAAFYAFTPMIAYFGRMPDHEAPALLFLLLFAWVLVIWMQKPTRARWLALAVLMILQAWTAWGGLICVFAVCAAALWAGNWSQRRSIIELMVVGVIAVSAVFVFYQLQWSGSIDTFIEKFLWRTSNQSLGEGSESFTWGQYIARILLRFITLFTPTICLIALPGVLPLLRESARLRKAIPLGLLAGGFAFVLLFRNASYVHDYYLLYITPALAIFAAVGLWAGWQNRRAKRWLRPVLVGMIVVTPVALIRYVEQLYQGSDQTEPLVIAAALNQQTTPDDLIMSSLPDIGPAIDFYAERDVKWGITLQEVTTRHDEQEGVYYFHCGENSNLPAEIEVVSELEVVPECWLTRLN